MKASHLSYNHIINLFLAVLFLSAQLLLSQTTFTLSGIVKDAASSEPLVAANIRVLGTSKGTITNSQGKYNINLAPGEYLIVFSYIAYKPDTVRINLSEKAVLNVNLVQSPVIIPEVVVIAEDPAIDIIRKAIANKRKWMDNLKSYCFEAFVRQVLKRDTSIASITEAYSTGYMVVGDTLREVVRQKRQTENIPSAENFAAVRRIINFNEDNIDLFTMRIGDNSSNYTFVGPTSPEALDYYDFRLLKTSSVSGVEVYQIKVIPKTRLKLLFEGTITIADETFAVMGVELSPNETFIIPFVKDVNLHYKQQFALYDSIFWMPVDMRVTGAFRISLIGLTMPAIGINLTSSIYDYKVNCAIPDSVVKKPRLTVDSSASVYDSTFWKENEVLPLTAEEDSAYKKLDSTQILEKQFQPKGPLALLGNESVITGLSYVDFRFNRVEGFFFGGKLNLDSLTLYTKFEGGLGYGFSDSSFKYEISGTGYASRKRKFGAGFRFYNRLDNVPDGGYYSPFTIALMALIDKNDYRDYFLAKGWSAFLFAEPFREMDVKLSFLNEHHYSMLRKTNQSFFASEKAYRDNPPVVEGLFRSVLLEFLMGDPPIPLDIVMRDYLQLNIEQSLPGSEGNLFDFTRYSGTVQWKFKTFARSLLFSPTLLLRLSGGTVAGILPPQRQFVLDSRASGYAPFGVLRGSYIKEYSGDRYTMLNVEHNFRNVPFLWLNIPFLYRNGIELILHGSAAQTWKGNISTSNGWYSDIGVGISRILDILRADITYRFKEDSRFFFSLSLASF